MVLFQLVFSILPTLLEVGLSCRLLALRFGPRYVCATLAMLVGYVGFTVKVANARAAARREMVTHDNERAAMLVDSLQNAATVRTFAGAAHEAARYDRHVRSISRCQLRAARSLAILNFGQAAIFSLGLGAMMAMAARPPLAPWAPMSVGGLTALNVLLGQLIMPFNFIGWTFQEMQQSVVDIRSLLDVMTARPLVADARDDERSPLPERARGRGSALALERVTFRYPPNDADAAEKPAGGVALHDVSLRIEPGEFVALVGPSGSGKVRAPLARNAPSARAQSGPSRRSSSSRAPSSADDGPSASFARVRHPRDRLGRGDARRRRCAANDARRDVQPRRGRRAGRGALRRERRLQHRVRRAAAAARPAVA